MPVDERTYRQIKNELDALPAILVAVSKTKPVEDIKALYNLGHRDFGENYVQELLSKQPQLPSDIRWHFIGHLQSNKVKQIAPFIHLIQSVDSLKLLEEINKQALKCGRSIQCLLQMHIAQEETKFGFDEQELRPVVAALKNSSYPNVEVKGLMGMASFSDDKTIVRSEFDLLKKLFDNYSSQLPQSQAWTILSMGMSGDYKLAVESGTNMVRIGSVIFGSRQ